MTSNLTVSSESQWNVDSNDILSIWKYCQLFMHTSNTFLFKICHWNQWANWGKQPQKLPLPLEACEPLFPISVQQCLGPPHSPCQTTSRSVHALPHDYATKAPFTTMGRPKFTPKLPLRFWWSSPHLMHPSLKWPHSPSPTASGSIQPFCYSTLSGQINTQAD